MNTRLFTIANTHHVKNTKIYIHINREKKREREEMRVKRQEMNMGNEVLKYHFLIHTTI